eukprot:evm.model.scf_354.3 EVM.evm.TU.scf_354.3   scf_354:8182-14300(-)
MPSQQRVDGLYAPLARSSVAIILIAFVGFTIEAPFKKEGNWRWHLTFLWLAMVNFFIHAPLVGRVARVGFQHIVGTLLGAGCGIGIITIASRPGFGNALWMTVATTSMVVLSIVLFAWYMKIPETSTMFILAILLPVFATESLQKADMFALSRIAGMIAGVVLMEILAVTVYPKSATQEVVRNIRSVLLGLCKLNQISWEHACMHIKIPREQEQETVLACSREYMAENRFSMKKGFIRMSVGPCRGGACEIVQALVAARLESALMTVYKGLEATEALLPITRTEIGIRVWAGRWIFLPGIPWRDLPTLPEEEISNVAWSIRKCARILWTLHLTFQDGLDEEMLEVVNQQYPQDLMPTLVETSQETFEDMYEAFPNIDCIEAENIERFRGAVEMFFVVGELQRRKVKGHMRKFKDQAVAREVLHNPLYRKIAESCAEQTAAAEPRFSGIYSRTSRLTRSQTMDDEAEVKGLRRFFTRNGGSLVSPRPVSRGKSLQWDTEDLRVPLLINSQAAVHGKSQSADLDKLGVFATPTSGHTSPRTASGSQSLIRRLIPEWQPIPEVEQDPPGSAQGSAEDVETGQVMEDVPSGEHQPGPVADVQYSSPTVFADGSKPNFTLPRVNTADLKDFPDTPEGYVSLVRWYSFQFLLEELSEEMRELHTNLNDLLPKLPDCGIDRLPTTIP